MQRAALFSGGDAQMAAGDLGELLVPYMPTIRVPKSGDRVYKTECAFSYDSPVSAAKPPPAASAPPPRRGRPAAIPLLLRPLPRCIPGSEGSPSPPPRATTLLRLQYLPHPSLCPPARLHLPWLPPQPALPSRPARAAGPPPPRVGVAAGWGPALPGCPCPARVSCPVSLHGAAGVAAGAHTVAVSVRSFVYLFFSLRRSELVLRHGDFARFWKLSCLLGNGLWLSEVWLLSPGDLVFAFTPR